MMRTVGLLSLAVGSLAVTLPTASSGEIRLGYALGNEDLQWNLTSDNSSSRVYTVKLESWQFAEAATANWAVRLSAGVDTVLDCPQCLTEKLDISAGVLSNGTFTGESLLSNGPVGTSDQTAAWGIEDNTANTNYDILFTLTCPLCSQSAELSRLQAVLFNEDNTAQYGAFRYIDDRNTVEFSNNVGQWGPTLRIDNIGASDYVVPITTFTGTDGILDSTSGIIAYYFQRANSNWTGLLNAYDSTTAACVAGASPCEKLEQYLGDDSKLQRVPDNLFTERGPAPAEAIRLGLTGTGTWYVKPYIVRRGTSSASVSYKIAIGLNKIPNSASGLVPSLVAVLLAAIALLFA